MRVYLQFEDEVCIAITQSPEAIEGENLQEIPTANSIYLNQTREQVQVILSESTTVL